MSSPPSRGRRVAAAVAVVALVLLAIWLLRGRPSPPAPGRAADSVTLGAVHRPGAAADDRPLPPPRPVTVSLPRAGTPIIDQIIVEKPWVCAGEENLITVRAHAPDPRDDAYLRYLVGGDDAASVPIRRDLPDPDRQQQPLRVTVFGRDDTVATAEVPPYEIRDCSPRRVLLIDRRLVPNTDSTFEMVARLLDVEAERPMKPVEYRWRFGDGDTTTTTVPWVEHDYSARSQDALHTQILIECTAVGEDGETVLGRRSLQLRNDAFENLHYKGVVKLLVSQSPRFPELDEGGRVNMRFTVWHHHPRPVHVRKVLRMTALRDGAGIGSREELEPEELFGTRVIGPQGVTAELVLDTRAEPQVYSADYEILGETEDGLPAQGNFSVMRPPDRPTADNSIPVRSKLLEAKIKRALELTGQPTVTDEDLLRLDREGKFDDLKATIPDTIDETIPPSPLETPKGFEGP